MKKDLSSRPLGTCVRIYAVSEGEEVGRAETFSAQVSFFQTPLVALNTFVCVCVCVPALPLFSVEKVICLSA